MALVATSLEVSNLDATPIVKAVPSAKGGAVRTAKGYIASTSLVGGTVGQWYTFVRVPVRARVLGVYLTNPTSTTGAVKFGLYRSQSGIAISDAVFSTVTVMGQANNRANVETVRTPAQRKDNLATAFATAISTAGAQNDIEVDIAATIVTVLGAAVDALVEVDYVLDD